MVGGGGFAPFKHDHNGYYFSLCLPTLVCWCSYTLWGLPTIIMTLNVLSTIIIWIINLILNVGGLNKTALTKACCRNIGLINSSLFFVYWYLSFFHLWRFAYSHLLSLPNSLFCFWKYHLTSIAYPFWGDFTIALSHPIDFHTKLQTLQCMKAFGHVILDHQYCEGL